MGKEKLILQSTMVGAVTNFTLNSILIPCFAENGAAVATVIAEAAVATVCLKNVRKYYDMKQIFCKIWQYYLAAAAILIMIVLVKHIHVHYAVQTVLSICSSVTLYFLMLIMLKNQYVREAVSAVREKMLMRSRRRGA